MQPRNMGRRMKSRDQREQLTLVLPTCERLWTTEETSQFLGIPVSTLHQWRYFAKGPNAFRVGRHLRYDPDAVRLWLVEQCVGEAS
jgi:Helix-turn-helix domain